MRDSGSAQTVRRRGILLLAAVVAAFGATCGQALAAGAASTPDLVFSDEAGAGATAKQAVTLTNSGTTTLKVIGSTTAADPHFKIPDDLCKSKQLAPQEACSVNVTFKATDAEPLASKLRFNTDAGEVLVDLRGNAPKASLDSTSLAFVGTVGTTSAAGRIVVINTGSGPPGVGLTNTGTPVIEGANFTVRDTTCSGTPLPKDGSCFVDVAFTPPATGGFEATLRLTTNDPVSPTVNVTLSGIGAPASVVPPPGAGPGTGPGPGPSAPVSGSMADSDSDDVIDTLDRCPILPGNLRDGCPSELNAAIVGRWRVNALLSQLTSLSVRVSTGSRIELRCSGDRNACGFSKRTIGRTTSRVTSLNRFFKGKRLLPAGASITVRVTRPQQTGTYKRLQTRRGRKLPKVSEGCLSARTGGVVPCA